MKPTVRGAGKLIVLDTFTLPHGNIMSYSSCFLQQQKIYYLKTYSVDRGFKSGDLGGIQMREKKYRIWKNYANTTESGLETT